MLAQFPRGSAMASKQPHFRKHNRRLTEVSSEMQKIIDDIQGKRTGTLRNTRNGPRVKMSDQIDSKKSELWKRHSDTMLKRPRHDNINCSQKDPMSRNSRKHRDAIREKEMGAQVALSDAPHDLSRMQRSCRAQSTRHRRPLEQKSKRADRHSLSPDSSYRQENKRCKIQETFGRQSPMAPWERPLPPVPGKLTTGSEGKLYCKLFQTVGERLNAKRNVMTNDSRRTPVVFTPSKHPGNDSLKALEDVAHMRYINNGDAYETVNSKTSPKVYSGTEEGEFEEDHIYECIDDADVMSDAGLYETIDAFKGRELFPATPLPRSRHSDIGVFNPERTPLSAFRTFRHEETYLEPVRSSKPNGCGIRADVEQDFISENHDSRLQDQITDFQDYPRDYTRSPASSIMSEESVLLRATYV